MNKTIIISTITILLLSITYYIGVQQQIDILAPGMKITNDTGINQETGSNVPVDEEGKPLPQEENTKETTSAEGGGGGNSNTEEQDTITNNECEGEQISYSIGNFQNTQTCNNEEEPCTEKEYDCSVEVTNYDETTGGTFSIQLTHYYINKGNKETIHTETKTIILEPKEKGTIHKTTTITTPLTNETIYCEALKKEAPKKNLC